MYERWDEFRAWARTAPTGEAESFDEVDVRAPAPAPRQVFGIGLNYRDHAAEAGVELPDSPTVFTKFVTSLTGSRGEIVLAGPTVDWESELVAVVGRRARDVSVAEISSSTGTPAGAGGARSPKRFLSAGDELVTTIHGIGEMRHRFVDGKRPARAGEES